MIRRWVETHPTTAYIDHFGDINEMILYAVPAVEAGSLVITYKNECGNQVDRKISNRKYDNLAVVLNHLVAKIS